MASSTAGQDAAGRGSGVRRSGVDSGTREEDFRAFVVARMPALFRTAYLLTGDHGHAEDLVQTALAKTYVAWSRVLDSGALEAYVRRTMVTTYTSWRRRRHWAMEVTTDELPHPDRSVAAEGLDAQLPDDELWTALNRLPPKQRAVVILRFYEDLSVEEVARLLDCPEGSVKNWSHRALATLRTSLAPLGSDQWPEARVRSRRSTEGAT